MFDKIVHSYYVSPVYVKWMLNVIGAVLLVFMVGLLALLAMVNNGDVSENPESIKEFLVGVFLLGLFICTVLSLAFIAYKMISP